MTTTVVIETVRTKPKTAGQIIFDKMFSVRMSVVDAMDENDVHSRGMFTTGYADIDAQAAKRPTVVWRTIAEMVELWHDGVAMVKAADRHKADLTLRFDGPGVQSMSALFEDFSLAVSVLPARTMIRCHRLTVKRLQAIRNGQVKTAGRRVEI